MITINLKNRVAIITGSSRGIGAQTALKLAENGAKVVINYPFQAEKANAENTAESIRKIGGESLLVEADISKLDDANLLIEETLDYFDKIDILVNNAGITRDNILLRMKEEEWDSVININLKGVFNCTKAAVKPMIKQRYGKIVNLASVVGRMGNAGQANYSASKAGIIGFTKSIAKELSGRNINVNAVAPGFIKSKMTEELSEKVKDEMLQAIPLNRFGLPEDVANLILFLVSPASDYITGQVINIAGGMLM